MKIHSHWSAISRQVTATPANHSRSSSSPTQVPPAFHSRLLRGALRIGGATILTLLLSLPGFAQPPIPSQFYYFPTNFDTLFGSPPIAYTNLISVPMDVDPQDGLFGNALILDMTNLAPAFLNYDIMDTNYGTPHRNIFYPSGTVLFYFAPNWASVSQGGSGPGETVYFVGGGDWSSGSPRGLLTIFADAVGSNIYFGGVGAGDAEIYASAPISWNSNTFHQVGVEWTDNDCEIYLDGELAGTGNGIMYVPARSTWTNGFFIGSDNTGYEQARGAFWQMNTWSEEYGAYYTNDWTFVSNAIAAWQGTTAGTRLGSMMGIGMNGGTLTGGGGSGGGGGFGIMMVAGTDDGTLNSDTSDTNYNTDYQDYTNFWLNIGLTTSGGPAVVSIQNALSNLTYNIVTNSVLDTNLADWGVWQTLLASNSVAVAAPLDVGSNALFFDAALVWSTTTNGLPDWWEMQYFGQIGVDPSGNPAGDGINNLQKYLSGLNPQVFDYSALTNTNGLILLTVLQ